MFIGIGTLVILFILIMVFAEDLGCILLVIGALYLVVAYALWPLLQLLLGVALSASA